MPVRFQVDPDFYDHPKTAGMSDSAFSLWVRAGSYSAAKLTDGFVSDAVLVNTLRSATSVADELVERGLWRRRRGGYVFHQWNVRNLTRQRVEQHNKSEARRKRNARQDKINTEEPHVRGQNVRPDAARTPEGLRPESDTVGVGVGVKTTSGTDQDNGYFFEGGAGGKPPSPRGSPRGTRIPDDFAVTDEMVAWARQHTPHVDGRGETAAFVDHWRSKTGRDATKLDWVATWRNWMRKAATWSNTSKPNPSRPSTTDQRVADIQALKGRLGGGDPSTLRALPGGPS